MTTPERKPAQSAPDAAVGTGLTLPEQVMLLLFNPRNGTIAGEGLTLMYTLGGAMLTELALRGHISLEKGGRRARAVGEGPTDPLLRGAWERIPTDPGGIRSIVVDIGPRLRETTLDTLLAKGEIVSVPRRFLGFIPSSALEIGTTGARDRLLSPVRSALVDGAESDDRTAALVALLSASGNLPAMHADIPWSGDIYTRGKMFERGDWGASAASDLIVSTLVVQVVGTAFAATVASIARPD